MSEYKLALELFG